MSWREGDMAQGEPWPEDVVRLTVHAYAKQHGQQSVWTGVAQLIHQLDSDLERVMRLSAEQDEQRSATHKFHVQTIDELRSENLRLRAEALEDHAKLTQ